MTPLQNAQVGQVEWRQTSKVHAVKLDCGHEGWEAYCGQRITDRFRLLRPRKLTFNYGVCQTCLRRTNSKVVIVPSGEPPETMLKQAYHKYLLVQLRCGCLYREQTTLRLFRDETRRRIFADLKANGRRCDNHHRNEKATLVMGEGETPITPSTIAKFKEGR